VNRLDRMADSASPSISDEASAVIETIRTGQYVSVEPSPSDVALERWAADNCR